MLLVRREKCIQCVLVVDVCAHRVLQSSSGLSLISHPPTPVAHGTWGFPAGVSCLCITTERASERAMGIKLHHNNQHHTLNTMEEEESTMRIQMSTGGFDREVT
jgi:hypothetical protein